MWFRKRPDGPKNFAPRAYAKLVERVTKALESLEVGAPLPESLFTSSVWSAHKARFEVALGKGKCGFCERYRDLERECQLDHFRPKKAVSSFAATPDCTSPTRPAIQREGVGYWWLAYTWANLVLVCPGCNGAKSSLFPVKARCAMREAASIDGEGPYLLDPHDDTLAELEHFRWTISGAMEPMARRSRAEWTIVVCDLNREGLVHDRSKRMTELRKAYEHYKRALESVIESRRRNGGVAAEHDVIALDQREADVRSLGSVESEFTGLARWTVARWCKEDSLSFEW
jgi:hypothetical protein